MSPISLSWLRHAALFLILALIITTANSQIIDVDVNLGDVEFEFSLTMTLSYDIVIVGGTPGGIMAAVAAARASNGTARILLLERTSHIGGLPANGLGATDIATQGATGGLFLEFVQRIKQHYVDNYGADSKQVKDCNNGYHFEPKVAQKVLEDFLSEVKGAGVDVLLQRQFDSQPKYAQATGGNLKTIRVLNRDTKVQESYSAKVHLLVTLAVAGTGSFPVCKSWKSEGVSVAQNRPKPGMFPELWGPLQMIHSATVSDFHLLWTECALFAWRSLGQRVFIHDFRVDESLGHCHH
jgi:hypothetical protein